jgi:replicative DNA helicase
LKEFGINQKPLFRRRDPVHPADEMNDKEKILSIVLEALENINGKKGKKIKGESALIIRKSKYGKIGTVNLMYRNNYCLFTDINT